VTEYVDAVGAGSNTGRAGTRQKGICRNQRIHT